MSKMNRDFIHRKRILEEIFMMAHSCKELSTLNENTVEICSGIYLKIELNELSPRKINWFEIIIIILGI
jgi:hypothetical protein